MDVMFNGLNATYATFKNGDDTVTDGATCLICSNGAVSIGMEEQPLCGVVTKAGTELVTVQLTGYCELPYDGETAPTLGLCSLTCGDYGSVMVASGGRQCLVVKVDTTAQKVGLFL